MMRLIFYVACALAGWIILVFLTTFGMKQFGVTDSFVNSFDAVNSIVAALAFIGIIYTIRLQQEELGLQRQELVSTRKEFEEQNQTLKKQRFESTFFNLVNLHTSITEKLAIPVAGRIAMGRDAVRDLFGEFKGMYLNKAHEQGGLRYTRESIVGDRQFVVNLFNEFYWRYEEYIGHYLRNIHSTLKFVAKTDLIEETEKSRYYEMMHSQLNSFEVCLIFYYFSAGPGCFEKDLFDAVPLGARLNTSLLPEIKHSYLFDPEHVVNAALLFREGEDKSKNIN